MSKRDSLNQYANYLDPKHELDLSQILASRDKRKEEEKTLQNERAKIAVKEAELKAVKDKYQQNPFKSNTVSTIESEITKAREDFQVMITKRIASEIKDPFIDSQYGASRDNLKPDIANIPGLFDESTALRAVLKDYAAKVKLKAVEIKNAPSVIEADKLAAQLQNSHNQEFAKIKIQMQEIPIKMVEKVKKALDVPQIPQPIPVANHAQPELSELEKLKSELALERKKIQDLEMMNKIILGQNVDLSKDKNYWQVKCEKKDAKVKELKLQLDELKLLADYVQHNPEDPVVMQMAGMMNDSDSD